MTHRIVPTKMLWHSRVFGIAAALAMLLAGCVMPDGTVYTFPVEVPPAVVEEATPTVVVEQDAPKVDEPSPADPYIEAGRGYFDAGDYAAALDQYDQAVAADPDEPLAYYYRGLNYALMGDLEAALADLDHAVSLAPDDYVILALHAHVLWSLGDAAAAAAEFDQVLTATNGGEGLERSRLEIAYWARAVDRYGKGDLTGVVADLAQYLRINPWNTDLYGEFSRLSQNAALYEEKTAEYDALASAATSPGSAAYAEGMKHLLRAQLLAIPDEYAAAVVEMSAAIEADPELAVAYHARGVARIMTAAYPQGGSANYSSKDGIVTYTDPVTGEEMTKSQEEYDAMLAEAEAAAQALRVAGIEDMTHALELEPTLVEAIHDLGVAHFAQQEQYMVGFVYTVPDEKGRDMALDLFDQAVALAPEWEQARLSRALASLHWGMQDSMAYADSTNSNVSALAFGADGATVVSLRADFSTEIWNTENGELLAIFPSPHLDNPDASITSAAFSADGARLVTAGNDQIVRIWDVTTGEELVALEGDENGPATPFFSPDGLRIATTKYDKVDMVRIRDATTGELLLELEASPPLAFSADGLQMVASDAGANLGLWDLQTGERIMLLTGPVDSTSDFNTYIDYVPVSIAFSADGQRVATISNHGALRMWDLANGDTARVLREPEDIYLDSSLLAFSPDGATLIATHEDGSLSVWDVASGEEVALFDGDATAVTYSPDGAVIATANPGGTINLRDAQSGELQMTLKRALSTEEMEMEANATRLLTVALEDAEFLIERGAGEGWPYYVRAFAKYQLSALSGNVLDDELETQLDADFATFQRLSPNVRTDDLWTEAAAQVRFSAPLQPFAPLMASRIEEEEGEQVLIHPSAGFKLQIPNQDPTGKVLEVHVADGPTYVVIADDFRSYKLLAMQGELGEMSTEQWFSEEMARLGISGIKTVGEVETEVGVATLFRVGTSNETQALLPVGDHIFYFSYAPVTWQGGGSPSTFASGYDIQLGPGPKVLEEFIAGLSLLPE